MTNAKLNKSEIELICSDWELDFYSRPILEKNGKKSFPRQHCSLKVFPKSPGKVFKIFKT